jgi:hypothetical protein
MLTHIFSIMIIQIENKVTLVCIMLVLVLQVQSK